MSVKFLGDDKLQQFLDNWDNVLACMDSQPPTNILESVFLKQIKDSRVLANDVAEYNRVDAGHPYHSSEFLIRSVRKYLRTRRQEENRHSIAQELGRRHGSTPALFALNSDEENAEHDEYEADWHSGQDLLEWYAEGSDSSPAAPAADPPEAVEGDPALAAKGKGRKRPKPKSPRNDNRPKSPSSSGGKGGKGNKSSGKFYLANGIKSLAEVPCSYFAATGKCLKGDKCLFKHEKRSN
jgi:hypothetical protein